MAQSSQQFRLLIDPLFGGNGQTQRVSSTQRDRAEDFPFLAIPTVGATYLDTACSDQLVLTTNGTRPHRDLCCFESVYHTERLLLLMLCPPEATGLSVNSQPASRIQLLGVGDQIQVRTQILHVTIYHRPDIGPAGEELTGCECGYCRIAFKADTIVFRCPCGAVLHCEPNDSTAPEDRFHCAQNISVCPKCQHPVHLEEGYLYVPPL